MILTLAIVLQLEKRQSHTCKDKPPFRQNCGTDVQHFAEDLGVATRIQQRERPCTLPLMRINLAPTTNNLKGGSLIFRQGQRSVWLVNAIIPNTTKKAVRPIDSEVLGKIRPIQAWEYRLMVPGPRACSPSVIKTQAPLGAVHRVLLGFLALWHRGRSRWHGKLCYRLVRSRGRKCQLEKTRCCCAADVSVVDRSLSRVLFVREPSV